LVYLQYEGALAKILDEVKSINPSFESGLKNSLGVNARRIVQKYFPRWIRELGRKYLGH
jgi:hypothetical protein